MSAVAALRSPPVSVTHSEVLVRELGLVDYVGCYQAMREFSARRNADTADEIWLVQHPPVFTLGLAANPGHVLDAGAIPVVRCDRGGQVTYHGPGQAVAYVMCDLKRRALAVRALVNCLEQSVIDVLRDHGVAAARQAGAPGVYVDGAKIAALGLRIARGCSYHGVALNVDMDLAPFARINPCGYAGMRVTQTRALGVIDDVNDVSRQLGERLCTHLAYA